MADIRYINLHDGTRAIIDDEDTDLAMGYRWYRQNNGYVVAMMIVNGVRRCILLHRHLLIAPGGTVVDHIDGNPLNNRRSNLRVTNQTINQANRRKFGSTGPSGIRGVHLQKKKCSWTAYIQFEGKKKHLGSFQVIEDAITARKAGELKYYGELCPEPPLASKDDGHEEFV